MAERALNLILDDINTEIKTVSFGSKITTHGLCYLQTKDEKTFPLENTGSRNGVKISWDDKYPLQIYHRIIDVEKESDNSKGFGANAHRQRVYSMRLVGIGSKDKITSTSYEDNQDIANTISDAMPNFISSTEYVEVTDHEVIKSVVYDSEFTGVDKNKVLSLEGIAFWIDYTLTVSTCATTTPVVPDSPITSFTYSNNDQSVADDGTVVAMAAIIAPSQSYTYGISSNDALPSFLTLNTSTGAITDNGGAKSIGSFTFEVIALLSATIADCATVSLTITGLPAWIPSDGLEVGTVIVGFDFDKNVTSAASRVSAVGSEYGEAVSATQGTASNQPVVTALDNNFASIFCSSESLTVTLSADIAPPYNIFIGLESSHDSNMNILGVSNNNNQLRSSSLSDRVEFVVGGNFLFFSGFTPEIREDLSSRPCIYMVKHKTGDHVIEIDAGNTFSSTKTNAVEADWPASFGIGNFINPVDDGSGKIGVVLITQGNITETDYNNIETYIATLIGSTGSLPVGHPAKT